MTDKNFMRVEDVARELDVIVQKLNKELEAKAVCMNICLVVRRNFLACVNLMTMTREQPMNNSRVSARYAESTLTSRR